MKLNLGSGLRNKEGFINIDNKSECPDATPDFDWDLNQRLKLPDNIADEVFTSHTIEHLQDPAAVIGEIHRILKTGGLVTIIVPHFSRGYMVHRHTRGFSLWGLKYELQNGNRFRIIYQRLNWDYADGMPWMLKPFCHFWNWFINLNHWVTERFLVYCFGGLMDFEVSAVKI